MDSSSISQLVAIIVLILLSAYFSATETAFTSLNRIRLKSRAEEGDRRAAATLALAEDYDRVLSTILVGNNVVNIMATTLSTLFFVSLLGQKNGPAAATVVITIVVLVFGEITPKSLAKEYPEEFAAFSTPFLRALCLLFRPVTFLTGQWKRLLQKVFRKPGGGGITEQELMTMVSEAESEGGLDSDESQLIRSAISFGDLDVEAILTPRVDIVAVEDTDDLAEINRVFAESGYSRLPVYHEDIDDIIGVIHEKDFHIARQTGRTDLASMISTVLYTTANTKISELLRILQRAKSHMAIVVDEYGGTEGLVTIEDIVEELVGEIWDEHDEIIEQFKKQEDGSYLISCNANLTDLYNLFSIRGDSDSTTVSGWVMEEIGRVPEAGDRFLYENLDVTVTNVDHRRVLEIQVVVMPEPTT